MFDKNVNLGLHETLTPKNKLLRQADLVWSRMKLEPNEVLFIKVSLAASHHAGEIAEMVQRAFGNEKDRVLIYTEGTLEIEKVSR